MPKKRNDPKEWTPVEPTEDTSECVTTFGRLGSSWEYVLCNPVKYSAAVFAEVALQLILHPERNSKNIRRADIISDSDDTTESTTGLENVEGLICTRVIRRRLMPRNPNMDAELEQTCCMYTEKGESAPSLVTYLCHYDEKIGVPYYVPDVLGVGFELFEGYLYLAYLPLPNISCRGERLQRVAINLLRTIHRHWYISLQLCSH
jgi:hypothetical protein